MIAGRSESSLGSRIRQRRLYLGMTQEQLGEKANLHYSYVGQMERGTKSPSLRAMKRIARALQFPIEELLEEKRPYELSSERERLAAEIEWVLKEVTNMEDLRFIADLVRTLVHRLTEGNVKKR